MASQNIEYSLSIKVKEDVADLVEDAEYTPVVEILRGTPELKLTHHEKIEWVEVTTKARLPDLSGKDGDKPVFVRDDNGNAGRFDIKFSAPKPNNKEIWLAFNTGPLIDPNGPIVNENDAEDPENPPHTKGSDDTVHVEPLLLDKDDFGKVFVVDEQGLPIELDEDDDDYGIRKKNSIGIINETRLSLFFWILPKHSDEPDLKVDHQAFEWLPGSGRIQLPPLADEGLKVKVWLEASQDDPEVLEGITFQDQTQKKLVAYEESVTEAEAVMNNLGLWVDGEEEEQQTLRTTFSSRAISKTTSKRTAKTAAKLAPKGPPTLSSKASTKKRLPTNSTAVGRA